MDLESLPATTSVTKLVSSMDQLHIAPSVGNSSDYLPDSSDVDLASDSDIKKFHY